MVSSQPSGLRFDIYERVHLPEEQASIREMNELELVPHIQVETDQDQALLRGHLLLTGKYASDYAEQGEQELEYYIPVEITLPANRIADPAAIGVEIESFDVDVLSSRSLNVTGVLSLQGIDVSIDDREVWEGEEAVFVHEAAQAESTQSRLADQVRSEQDIERTSAASEDSPPSSIRLTDLEEEGQEISTPEAALSDEVAAVEEEEAIEVLAEAAPEIEAEADEKKELKIAFNSHTQESGFRSTHDSYSSLLHTSEQVREARQAEAEAKLAQAAEAAKAVRVNADTLEWKKLFLQKEEENQFRKVRMCIVQKQDTLDSIAERFSKNAREIKLHNRLTEDVVQEGQVIYIP